MGNANFWMTVGQSATAVVGAVMDANFKAYLVGNAQINTNGDTEIQISEAQAYTGTIKCNGKNIFDLTGIKEFINITELNCHTNNLTSLDLSQNTVLTNLNCHTNNLTSLDLSQNILLTNLRCNINNLDNLDLSKNIALTNLNCHTNHLTNLDLSQNTALTQLYCNINHLTNLDLSQNTALTRLYCNKNELVSLNVKNGNNSNFTNFDAKNNEDLDCIEVDNATYSAENWINIGLQTNFSENCEEFLATSDNDLLTKNISIYPNPTNSILHFSSNAPIEKVVMTNMLGQQIIANLNNDKTSLDLSNLSAGNYFVKITTQGVSKTYKILKQ